MLCSILASSTNRMCCPSFLLPLSPPSLSLSMSLCAENHMKNLLKRSFPLHWQSLPSKVLAKPTMRVPLQFAPCSKCHTTKGHTQTHIPTQSMTGTGILYIHSSIYIDIQQFYGRPANCAHLLDFNVGHGFYAAFNNAASNPQKSHPPIYNGNANRSPSQLLELLECCGSGSGSGSCSLALSSDVYS